MVVTTRYNIKLERKEGGIKRRKKKGRVKRVLKKEKTRSPKKKINEKIIRQQQLSGRVKGNKKNEAVLGKEPLSR